MKLAKEVSTWSKDPSTKIGSVAVSNKKQILSLGYNGFPSKIKDDDRLFDRPEKLKLVIHSEMNLILNALKNGVSLDNAAIFVYNLPICSSCAKHVIQSGISEIYLSFPKDIKEMWIEESTISYNLFKEANINVNLLDWSKI